MSGVKPLAALLQQAAAATSAAAAPAEAVSQEVRISEGVLRGGARDEVGVVTYKGIPFAAPPVGPLRWQSPQAPPPWEGVRDATRFGNRCFSAPMPGPSSPIPESEDCLTLNVWTPAQRTDEALPVMVWLHGGGFQFGASSNPPYDGARLAARGVVLVSLNYRLGVFGFLAHPELDHGDAPSGNFGLQDQIAALVWVRQNITRFGGDPANVTLFGESAGAHAVGLLMASPLAQGLFAKAIAQSGAFWDDASGSLKTAPQARAHGEALAKRLGDGTVQSLQALPADALNAQSAWRLGDRAMPFGPSIDGLVVEETPAHVFAQGGQANIPLLVGWNGFEGAIFLQRALPHENGEAFATAAAKVFGEEAMTRFLELYPAATSEQAKASAHALVGDMIIAEQTWEMGVLHQASHPDMPVYVYNFGYTSAYTPMPAHTAEVSFVFGTLTPQPTAPNAGKPDVADHTLADQLGAYWTCFARTGNPNGAGLPPWPRYDGAGGSVLQIAGDAAAAKEWSTERFQFLRGFRGPDGRFPEQWRD